MAASALLLVALKIVFSILTCVMVAALAYGLVMDGFYSCLDPHARWMQVALIGALRSPPRELRNEPNYVQNGVEMNEIS
ncbi:hypothetical protein Tco_1099770 [Tanacetum coccineum]